VLLAGAVAYVAALLLAPAADQLIQPVPVDPGAAFGAAALERGRDFRRPQIAIGLAGLVAQVVVLAWVARRPPSRLRRLRRPVVGGAAAGAGLALLLVVVQLPLSAVARQRALDVGLSTQTWPGWFRDLALSASIQATFGALLAGLAIVLVRRFPRWWWLPASGVVVLVAGAIVFAGPIVLDPAFNRFEPLPRGALRADVLRLARSAGVRVGEVFVMDASRRTSGANAYVTGLGSTKRVVIYDNVLRRFPPAEARSIVAHELGHQRYGDLGRGLLYVAIVAPWGVLAVALLAARLSSHPPGTPAALPALALALVLVSTGIGWISNGLSRKVEARADAFALRATGDPAAFISLQRRLVVRNVGDPDPPAVVEEVLATHPSAVERVGMARAAQAGARAMTP
jgi:STE24 endopeptidase